MTHSLLDHFDLPESAYLGKKLFKKLFYEKAKLTARDKKLLKEEVLEIQFLYALRPATVNIPVYEQDSFAYHEIAFIEIKLRKTISCKSLAETIQKAIPNPVFLLFSTEAGDYQIHLCHKRTQQNDKIKLESDQMSEWFGLDTQAAQAYLADCALPKLSFENLFALYADYRHRLIRLKAALISGAYRTDIDDQEDLLIEYNELESELASLRSALKKESQFNRKVQLNMQIKRRQESLQKVKVAL